MKNLTLSELEIKILMRCKTSPVSKRDITQMYKKNKKIEKEMVINSLVDFGYIKETKLPKPDTKKTPTFYFITEAGEKWIEQYLKFFD